MEGNNDFEEVTGDSELSGEGYKDAAATLLGTNEKSSSMTSRERVDDALEEGGAEALSKFGVSKKLGKKAIKKDGGTFAPTHGPTQRLAKNYSRNKLAEGVDKIDAAKNRAGSGREAFANRLNDKNYYKNAISNAQNRQKDSEEKSDDLNNKLDESKNKLNDLKKSGNANKDDLKKAKGDLKEAKKNAKDNKNNLKQAKQDEKNVKKDNLKSKAFQAAHPVEAAKMIAKKAMKKVLIAAAPYIAGLILAVILVLFIVEIILGPLMEVWGNIDEAVTGVANFAEKLDNFYNGFGFQDSKEAFYDELDNLCERYGCTNDGTGLDVPLLLSTLFYTEGMGYDTAFDGIEADGAVDGSLNANGSNSSMFDTIRSWMKEKFDESQETVDENGLTYNAGKIYRLRKLARNQFNTNAFGVATRQGREVTVSMSDFIEMIKNNVTEDFKILFADVFSFFKHLPSLLVSAILSLIMGSDYVDSFFYNQILRAEDTVAAVKQLFADVFYGICDITGLSWSVENGVEVTYREFEYDEDNYKNYLFNYYFEYIPEFSVMLGGLDGDARENKKLEIYNEIIENKNLFKDIFLQYQSSTSEEYANSCVGAIDSTLVAELNLPVDIASGQTVSFDSEYSYGVVNGVNHNGVDLNQSTAGVPPGSNVYVVANGEIASIYNATCSDGESCGKSIKISHDVIIDNTEFKFFTIYSNVVLNNNLSVGDPVMKGSTLGTIYTGASNTEGLHFTFMDANTDSSGIAIDPTNLFIECSSGTLSGDTAEEQIWNYLCSLGYTMAGVAGVMGNWMQESGLASNNVQNGMGYTDEDYTNGVNNGTISRSSFGNDSRGYGLAQWTYYTRKLNLYDFKASRNVGIDDLQMQLEFYKNESNNYSGLNEVLSSTSSIQTAVSEFQRLYEGAGVPAMENRYNYAQEIYNRNVNR